jgi:signal transduction histidine kinase/ligand-binding sensor domain-containing protein
VHETLIENSKKLRPVFLLMLLFVHAAYPERLPIKLYTSAEGLVSSAITHVARDSQGFLWFSNRDGLSRFDGTEFVNYRLPETATSQTFRHFLETKDGWIWLATDDGLYRTRREDVSDVRPRQTSEGRDRILDAKKVWNGFSYGLFEDSRGTLWIGGSKLHRVDERTGDQITVTTIETPHTDLTHTFWISEGDDGSLWLSQLAGPLRVLPDGRQIFYPIERTAPGDEVYSLDVADDGRVWFAQAGGLYAFLPGSVDELAGVPTGTSRPMRMMPTIELGSSGDITLPSGPNELTRIGTGRTTAVFADGSRVVAVISNSLFVFDKGQYRRVGAPEFLPGTTRTIVTDAQNNLWFGSTGGAIQYTRDGFETFGFEDGLADPQVSSVFASPGGDVLIAHGLWRVSRYSDGGFESVLLNVPRDVRFTWTSAAVVSDRNGNLYALAREGLFRFDAAASLTSQAEARPKDFPEQAGRPFYRAFSSSDGKVWFGLRGYTEQNGLLRYDPQTGVFEDMSTIAGYPKGKPPASFAEDRAGNLWFGFYGVGGIVKYDGTQFREFEVGLENARGTLALLTDKRGRLWIGSTSHGVLRIADPTTVPFAIERLTEDNGLSSNNVRALVDDEAGNVYVGTVRGVDRVSLETDVIRHFSTADGLAADFINAAFRDRNGALWFGTPNGLSRLIPPRDEAPKAPSVLINDLQIAGEPYSISQFGQSAVAGLDLSSAQSNLQIRAVGVGSKMRYQYRLEGSGNDQWSTPDPNPVFNFANLAPGSYTFVVRAISAAGIPSTTPASVSFVINPPFYRTWWFYGLVAMIVVGSVIALDRYRVSKTRQIQAAYDDLRRSEKERRLAEAALEKSREDRLAELERVRTRIATDLHDDIGSSLTQIAVLSQAAHSQAGQNDARIAGPLERISDVSVELVNAMSDIVWAINPRRDNLRDLVQRMRRFAADIFTAKGIRFEFHAPPSDNKLAIGANIRREVFAIFKEAVNNVARHSGAANASIELTVSGEKLSLVVEDNGRGFDPEALLHMSQAPESGGGNGLVNIRRRTGDLGGHCEIVSSENGGTTVKLEIPLGGLPYTASHSVGEFSVANELESPSNGNDR